jgi:hypothetical protein
MGPVRPLEFRGNIRSAVGKGAYPEGAEVVLGGDEVHPRW